MRLVVSAIAVGVGLLTAAVYLSLVMIKVPEDSFLAVRFKGNFFVPAKMAAAGQWAQPGEVGPLRETFPTGTYFKFAPWWYERRITKKLQLAPGQVAKVVHLLGEPAPDNSMVVEGGLKEVTHKGTLRELLGVGIHELNPFGFTAEVLERVTDSVQTSAGTFEALAGWVYIRPGYVGVKTVKIPRKGETSGVQEKTLPPGFWVINPLTEQVTEMEIGYWLMGFETQLATENGDLQRDQNGDPIPLEAGSDIKFPSKDGHEIFADLDLIWGMMPETASKVLSTIGPRPAVEALVRQKVLSLVGTRGSAMLANSFQIGVEREKFQLELEKEIRHTLEGMGLLVEQALVRKVYVPQKVREPVQAAFLAKERQATAVEEKETAKVEALFLEAQQNVELMRETTEKDTERLREVSIAKAAKEAAVMTAANEAEIAKIDRETAVLEAEAFKTEEEAKQKALQLAKEAEAELNQMAVSAFGTPEAYNAFLFAENLPEDIRINLIYAGQGTFWTDMSKTGVNIQPNVAGASKSSESDTGSEKTPAPQIAPTKSAEEEVAEGEEESIQI
jgi:hypothetical protein